MKKALIIALVGAPIASQAQFFDNFDVDSTANWIFNSSFAGDLPNNNSHGEANFFFDYGEIGIPSAPNSVGGTTRGLKMEANVFGTNPSVFMGVSASPLGQSFTGDYILTFDAWQNFQGPFPVGGNGTTQALLAGIGTTGIVAQFPGGNFHSVGFASTNDGGSSSDYRAYTASGAPLAETSGVYAAGNTAGVTNHTHSYYAGFQGTVPAAQTTWAQNQGFLDQHGSTHPGVLGMAWRQWRIERAGSTVTWHVDGLLIATVTGTNPQGDNIFVGYFDTNTGASTQAISRQLLFGLVDNVRVTPVPEPGTLAVLGLGALGLLRRRRR